ncbi:MAG: hypothetical protein K2Q18_16135 [Bdellovibrionales bacterium]|nr:hypothetical protein [Bdellovibrionales bacterium]
MIQTHQQLLKIREEYNTLFSKNEFYPIQKAYTTPHFLVLGLRFPGQNVVLYIGRGNQYEGIFISNKFPPPFLRIQDRLLDYVRRYLVGTRLGKMEIDENHFLALFHFKNEHTDNSFSFGYKDRQLFFIKQSKDEVYTSWNGETLENFNIPKILDQFLGNKTISDNVKESAWTLEKYFQDEQKKVSGKPIQKKKEKFLEKKLNNITNDLEDVKKWHLMEEDLLSEEVFEFGEHQTVLHGHKIKFESRLNQWQKRDIVFGKIKKLKRAELILQTRLSETDEELSKVKEGEFEFEVTKEKAIAPLWHTSKVAVRSKEESAYNIRHFRIKNLSGSIALDAASNDWLRSQGGKDHYWFHVENYTGAHCLIKTDDLGLLDEKSLAAIASMLRDYSQLSITEVPVIFSQVKNVKGLKGVQGKVLIKKPKYLRCTYLEDWKEIITLG